MIQRTYIFIFSIYCLHDIIMKSKPQNWHKYINGSSKEKATPGAYSEDSDQPAHLCTISSFPWPLLQYVFPESVYRPEPKEYFLFLRKTYYMGIFSYLSAKEKYRNNPKYWEKHAGKSKQRRPRSGPAQHGVRSGATLFATHPTIFWAH